MKADAAAVSIADQESVRSRQFGEAAPFLEQSRAQNTLRHELERLFAAVKAGIDDASTVDADLIAEFSAAPNRIIARCGSHAISFSWLTGRLGGVSDGYLLVIEWADLQANRRGVEALKSAKMSRETSYHPEAADAASWRWRTGKETAAGAGTSTLDLVAAWFNATAIAARRELASA